MDFEIPESLVKTLLGAIAAESPLARRLNEFGACHGSVTVPANLFDAHSLNTLYSLCFFQAVDGILFRIVTGVQTCALPIYLSDEVYLAMVSRGFRGEARMLEPLQL